MEAKSKGEDELIQVDVYGIIFTLKCAALPKLGQLNLGD